MEDITYHKGYLPQEFCDYCINHHKDHSTAWDIHEYWNSNEVTRGSPMFDRVLEVFAPIIGREIVVTRMNITIYNVDDWLIDHKDANSTLTLVANLNEGYTGGMFRLNGKDVYDLRRGDVIMFNGARVPHGVSKVESGTRYSLNLWTQPKVKSLM